MEREEAIKNLKEIQKLGDKELAHIRADDVLCDFLNDLGYHDITKEYEKVGKWYA